MPVSACADEGGGLGSASALTDLPSQATTSGVPVRYASSRARTAARGEAAGAARMSASGRLEAVGACFREVNYSILLPRGGCFHDHCQTTASSPHDARKYAEIDAPMRQSDGRVTSNVVLIFLLPVVSLLSLGYLCRKNAGHVTNIVVDHFVRHQQQNAVYQAKGLPASFAAFNSVLVSKTQCGEPMGLQFLTVFHP